MNSSTRLRFAVYAFLVGALLPACSGGSSGDRDNRGDFEVSLISTGRGQIYPYRIREVDSFGNPTNKILQIEDVDTLQNNVNGNNGVLPVATFDTTAILPDGSPGNHYIQFMFSHKLDVDSVLSDLLANQTNSGLTTAVSVLAYNPATESTVTLSGRGFVNGFTFFNVAGALVKTLAVEDVDGTVTVVDSRADGFPLGFNGAEDLVTKKAFVFVADTDDDLSTIETFPAATLIRLVITNAVRDSEGGVLEQEVTTATTVGLDPNPPDVLGFSTAPNNLEIFPGSGQAGVDPSTDILVRFNKPVQPGDVGSFFDPANLTPTSGGVTLSVTAAAQTFSVIYYSDPLSFGDLTNYRIRPAYSLPGSSGQHMTTVNVIVNNTSIRGLGNVLLGNTVQTNFTTGAGAGLINAPVSPEAIYVGIGGSNPGVSVIDLNGFGQGTGDINDTNFPLNPNIGVPGVIPPLAPGTQNLDAGGRGPLSLVQDTNLSTRLLSPPTVGQIADIHIGAPLDLVFNNESINVNATRTNQINPATNTRVSGNTIMIAPHPNPPRLRFPPPNPSRSIFGEEPTVASNNGCTNSGPINLLVSGNPFSLDPSQVGIFGNVLEGVFYGPEPPPQSPPPPPTSCAFQNRQQIGHFLYVLDAQNKQVLVVNSNRFTVLDTIRLTDPFAMALSPNLSRLAVSNFASSSVSFIDTNPFSPTFHTVVTEVRVGQGPTDLVFQPEGEDVLVLSTPANLVTILTGADFQVRSTASGFLSAPRKVAVTPRYTGFGFSQGIYFAYILNANGTVAVYESGPDGVNGIGFNNIIGSVPGANFRRARSMRYDFTNANGAVWIGHVDENGQGQLSHLEMTSSPGQTPLNPNSGGFVQPPTFRQKEWGITAQIGGVFASTPVKSFLSGNTISDFAVDDMINQGGLVDLRTAFSSSIPLTPFLHSGKGAVKTGNVVPIAPKLLFVALSDVGKVDVLELGTGLLIASINVPGVTVISSYWRQ